MKFLSEVEQSFEGKKVFVRVDFNVPLKDGVIQNNKRILASIPTIKKLLDMNASVILASHLGRPKGAKVKEFSLEPVAYELSKLLDTDVSFCEDCVGDELETLCETLRPKQILLLENLRFYKAETENDEKFSRQLSALADIYVNDAFGTVHRAHASTCGMVSFFPLKYAGFLIEKEVKALSKIVKDYEKPFVAIIGGAKVSDKLPVLSQLLNRVDKLVIGGAMAYTFLKAKGIKIGNSMCEENKIHNAKSLLNNAEKLGVEIILPVDHLVCDEFN